MTLEGPTSIKLVSIAAVSALMLGACGGDDDAAAAGDADVNVVAFDSMSFDEDAYTVEAGEVTFQYTNDGQLVHTLLVQGEDGFKLQVNSQGATDTGSVELEPGEYTIYCDEPGHAGMDATLTVEEPTPTETTE